MDEPKLKKVFIGKNKWAEHVGRGVSLMDDNGVLVSRLGLSGLEKIRLDNYEARVKDAWREYDASLPCSYHHVTVKKDGYKVCPGCGESMEDVEVWPDLARPYDERGGLG